MMKKTEGVASGTLNIIMGETGKSPHMDEINHSQLRRFVSADGNFVMHYHPEFIGGVHITIKDGDKRTFHVIEGDYMREFIKHKGWEI